MNFEYIMHGRLLLSKVSTEPNAPHPQHRIIGFEENMHVISIILCHVRNAYFATALEMHW